MELAADDVAEEVLDEAAREGVASAAQAALREAKNEELQRRLHHESKMSAAEDVCESITGMLSRGRLSLLHENLVEQSHRGGRGRDGAGGG